MASSKTLLILGVLLAFIAMIEGYGQKNVEQDGNSGNLDGPAGSNIGSGYSPIAPFPIVPSDSGAYNSRIVESPAGSQGGYNGFRRPTGGSGSGSGLVYSATSSQEGNRGGPGVPARKRNSHDSGLDSSRGVYNNGLPGNGGDYSSGFDYSPNPTVSHGSYGRPIGGGSNLGSGIAVSPASNPGGNRGSFSSPAGDRNGYGTRSNSDRGAYKSGSASSDGDYGSNTGILGNLASGGGGLDGYGSGSTGGRSGYGDNSKGQFIGRDDYASDPASSLFGSPYSGRGGGPGSYGTDVSPSGFPQDNKVAIEGGSKSYSQGGSRLQDGYSGSRSTYGR